MDEVVPRNLLPYSLGESLRIGQRRYSYQGYEWADGQRWMTLTVMRDAPHEELDGEVVIDGTRWVVSDVTTQAFPYWQTAWRLRWLGESSRPEQEGQEMSPSVSKKQQRFFGAQLAKKRAGKPTDVDMSEAELEKMAATKHKGLPEKKKAKK